MIESDQERTLNWAVISKYNGKLVGGSKQQRNI